MTVLRLHGGVWKKPHPLVVVFTTLVIIGSVCLMGETDAGSVRSNFVVERPLLEILKGILKERNLIQKSGFSANVVGNGKKMKTERAKKDSVAGSASASASSLKLRSSLLRDELNKETQDNCLSKILCGAAPAKPAAPPVNADYALLVKEFFDFFGSDEPDEKEPPKKASDDEKDDDEDEEDSAARSGNGDLVNITGSVELSTSGSSTQKSSIFLPPLATADSSAEVITTSTSATITTETTGASLTPLTSMVNEIIQEAAGTKKVTLEEIVGELRLTPEEFLRLRTARSMRLISKGEKKQSSYVRRKLREMKLAKSASKKLKIAGEIASSMRSPRQCRDFDKVASEVLSTCPLTSEVVRYFNSNLQNGTQIALVKNSINATDAGLVLLGDVNGRPQTYFVDKHAVNANTKINSDLKNPSVSDRYSSSYYQIYEDAFPGVQDVSKVSITNTVKKEPKKKVQDDEEDSDEEEEDEEDEGDAEDDDDEGSNDEVQEQKDDEVQKDEDTNDDESQKDDEESEESVELFRSAETRKRKASKKNKNLKKKKQRRPPKTTPAPIQLISVYGVPQPSFDHEFSQISGQIGAGPVILFDQDDYDSHLPNLGPPRRDPGPRPTRGKTTLRSPHKHLTYSSPQKGHKIIQKNKPSVSHPVNHGYKTIRPQSTSILSPSRSRTDYEVLQSTGNNNDLNSRYRNQNQRPQGGSPGPGQGQPPSYFTQTYGQTPGTRPGEYYRNGIPPRPRPVTPSYNYRSDGRPPQMGMNYYDNSVRGRLNFVPNPAAGLVRPPASMAPHPNFRFYG